MSYNLDLILELFPEFSSGILPDSNEYYVIAPKRKHVFIPTLKDINYKTITFYVEFNNEDEILFIHTINNAMGISGKETLRRIEQFCLLREPQIKKISLEDASTVTWKGYDISLSRLNILKKGLSYYNEQGYLQSTFTEDVSHWNNLKNKKFLHTFQCEPIEYVDSLTGNTEKLNLDKKLEETALIKFDLNENLSTNEILSSLVDFLSEEDTFRDAGIFLNDTIKNNRDEDPIIVLNLFTLCCMKIKYETDQILIKEL